MNWKLDLGHVITLLAMLASIAWTYGQISTAIEHQDRRIAKLEEIVNLIKNDQTSATKLRGDDRLEVTRVLVELQTEMRLIRNQLDTLARAQSSLSSAPVIVPARPTTR